jgi:hypothetical protein
MMSRTFIKNEILFSMIGFLGIVFIFADFSTFLFFLFLFTFIYFLFRKQKFIYRDRVKRNSNIFVSPVNGVVEKIKNDIEIDGLKYREVTILISLFNEWGLYFPMSSEVDKKYETGSKRFFRFNNLPSDSTELARRKHVEVEFRSKENKSALLRIFPCKVGFKPSIYPMSGDRGIYSSCFGLLPFGGMVQIFLPSEGKLFVEEGDLLLAGESVLANLE